MSRARLSSGKRVSYVPTATQVQQFGGLSTDRWPAEVISARGLTVDLRVLRPDGTSVSIRTNTGRIDFRSPEMTGTAVPPAESASAVGGTVEMWVGQDGSDSAEGSQAAPLATLAEALRRAIGDGDVDVRTVIWLMERTDGQRYEIPAIDVSALNAPLEIVGIGDIEVATGTAAGGSGTNVVIDSGLTPDDFRGRFIEITSGPALGDKRGVNDNDATDIVPCAPFSAAVANGNTYRIFRPSVGVSIDPTLINSPWLRHVAPGSSALVSTAAVDMPLLYLVNVNLDPIQASGRPLILVNSTIALFGVEFEGFGPGGLGLAGIDYDSTIMMGTDAADEGTVVQEQRANIGLRHGAPLKTSWVGYGVVNPNLNDFPLWRSIRVHGFIVLERFVSFGVRGLLLGGAFYANGIRCFGGEETMGTELMIRGDDGENLNFEISGATWAVEVRTAGRSVQLFLIGCTITTSNGPAVLCQGNNYIRVRDNDSVITAAGGSNPAFRAELGGRIDISTGMTVTAAGNELEITNGAGGVAASSTYAALATVGAHIAHTDGSVIQRVD